MLLSRVYQRSGLRQVVGKQGGTVARKRTTSDDEVGTRETAACRFWHVSLTVTFMPFHALVHLAMSSPTFFGDCSHEGGRVRHGGESEMSRAPAEIRSYPPVAHRSRALRRSPLARDNGGESAAR